MTQQAHSWQNVAQKIQINDQWHWQFGNLISKGYPYLEERPWTPQIIDGKLCFSVRLDNNKWKVIWGEEDGREYDDVFGITDFKQNPLYVARNQDEWFLVHDKQESQRYPFQITYQATNDKILICRFGHSIDNVLGEFTIT
jgi:hypothetical protein